MITKKSGFRIVLKSGFIAWFAYQFGIENYCIWIWKKWMQMIEWINYIWQTILYNQLLNSICWKRLSHKHLIFYFKISRCEPGLVPKPDTITGCGPECVIDPDCPGDYVCEQQKCSPRPDPCDPSPCGPGAICTVGPSGNPICRYVLSKKVLNICSPPGSTLLHT